MNPILQFLFGWLNPATQPQQFTISIANIEKALTLAENIKWPDVLAAIQKNDWTTDIVLAEDVLKVVGVFFPPAVIIENDLAMVVDVVQLLLALSAVFGSSDDIPKVTKDFEEYIEERFGR